jgi:competence protein ComEC
MRSWMIAFSLGILLGGMIPGLPNSLYLPLLFIPFVLSKRFVFLRLSGAYCLGLFWVLYWAATSAEQVLPAEWERKDFWVRGEVVSLPDADIRSSRFTFKVNSTCLVALSDCSFDNPLLRGQFIQLSLYQKTEIQPGQHWQFKVRLKRPHGFMNPGSFDYEAWLWQKKIRASGYVRQDDGNQLIEQGAEYRFVSLRYGFIKKLNELFPDGRLKHEGLIRALSIGDRQGISQEQWDLFSLTGTNHLVVISGMHLGFIAALFYGLCHFIFRKTGKLALYFPVPRMAALFAVIAAYIYAGMAGFSLPVQRAFIMICAFMLAQCCCRHSSVSNSYCMALGLVLLLNPLAPVSSGFWLSFVAVAVLIFVVRQSESDGKQTMLFRVCLVFKAQLYIFVILLPFMLLFFQQSSLAAPLVNLFAIPYLTLLLVPLCLLVLFLSVFAPDNLLVFLCYGLEHLFEYFISALQIISQLWPQAMFVLPALNQWQWLTLPVAVGLLAYGLKTANKARTLSCLLCASAAIIYLLFFTRTAKPSEGEFHLHILDVGQGLAAVISTAENTLLYDLGPAYSENFNAGEAIVLPFLRSQQLKHPSRVLVSHGDNDHSGGLPAILQAFPQAEYLSSDISLFPEQYQSRLCRTGESWNWDGVEFQILHPDNYGYNSNNSSCVLKVSNATHAVLLSGDIEKRVESSLLNKNIDLAADILIAPHHGSKTSSHKAFIEAVSPRYVVFSAGYLNQFNHPHPDIVNLYTNSGTIALNTAETGAISWSLGVGKDLPEASLFRQDNRRFWRVLP